MSDFQSLWPQAPNLAPKLVVQRCEGVQKEDKKWWPRQTTKNSEFSILFSNMFQVEQQMNRQEKLFQPNKKNKNEANSRHEMRIFQLELKFKTRRRESKPSFHLFLPLFLILDSSYWSCKGSSSIDPSTDRTLNHEELWRLPMWELLNLKASKKTSILKSQLNQLTDRRRRAEILDKSHSASYEERREENLFWGKESYSREKEWILAALSLQRFMLCYGVKRVLEEYSDNDG